jgi:hypothetical protein
MPDNRSNNKRTNLFLLRVWCDDDDENGHEDESGGPCRIWHGKVQRTVSGEVRSFETKDRLIEVLEGMIYKELEERPEQSRPIGKASSEAGVPEKGNNQIEANKGDNHVR